MTGVCADDAEVRNRTGLLVVRVWIEGDSDDAGLRARITQTVDCIRARRS